MNCTWIDPPCGHARTSSAEALHVRPNAPPESALADELQAAVRGSMTRPDGTTANSHDASDSPFGPGERTVEDYTQTIVPLMGRLVGIARRILGDEAHAWDAVQEALIGLWKTGSLPSDPGTWLTRAVVLRSLHLARTRARRRRHEREACDRRREATDRDDPSRRLDYRELSRVLDDALCSLPAEYREVMLLRAGARMDYAAIAEALGIPIGTVRSRLNRTRAHFRAVLSRHDLLDHDRDGSQGAPDPAPSDVP